MLMTIQDRLTEIRRAIAEVQPEEARELQTAGAALIDVREAEEVAAGLAEDAQPISRGMLELRVEQAVPDRARTVLLMCGSGTRSLLAADALRQLGYRDVRSVAGGFSRWRERELPWKLPDATPDPRYARQASLPEVGPAGQKQLADARVLLIGAGGLGAPAALYLAGAGVGTLGVVDHDRVELSNLHRQVLHTTERIGQSKTASARAAIAALNPEITVETYSERLTSDNVERIFSNYDIVVDGSDNFPTRYLVNDACCRLACQCLRGGRAIRGQGIGIRARQGPLLSVSVSGATARRRGAQLFGGRCTRCGARYCRVAADTGSAQIDFGLWRTVDRSSAGFRCTAEQSAFAGPPTRSRLCVLWATRKRSRLHRLQRIL